MVEIFTGASFLVASVLEKLEYDLRYHSCGAFNVLYQRLELHTFY